MENHNPDFIITYFPMKAPEVNLVNGKIPVKEQAEKDEGQVK